MALCEFRNRHQVGFAAMDLHQRTIELCQYGENQTYAHTAMWVQHFMPKEILVPDRMVDSALANRLRDEFPNLFDLHGIPRRYFHESGGLNALHNVGTRDSLNLLNLDATKYLCTAAAHCLIKFIESTGK